MRGNWITIIALVVPAVRLLRAFRIFRVARAARGLRLVRVVGATNRGVNALRTSLGRRGLGYVLGTTVIVILLGAAGMLAFEPASEVDGGFKGYSDALWWTAMLLTTIGSAFWPQTVEGRLLCFILSLFGMTVFGYITASLASFLSARKPRTTKATWSGRVTLPISDVRSRSGGANCSGLGLEASESRIGE